MSTDRVVEIEAGTLAGSARGAVDVWLGVPYAEPPVGRLRFTAPTEVRRWRGVRPAVVVGGAAQQLAAVTAARSSLGTPSEDCLYLNVFAPAVPAPPRPVLVWIHGGAFTSGSGALYDGSDLAASGDVVVVTLNYRLGVLGLVDLGAVTDADIPSNLGLRDQIAALAWVRDNIAAFGGDPARVTVAGESAGSIAVSLLLTAPSARGLFRSAIMQSGSYSLIHGADVRAEVAQRYADELGLGPSDADRLWEVPAERLLAAQHAVRRAVRGTVPAAPWFDGDLVPDSLAAAQAAVRPEVPLLIGHNHDEVTLFQLLPGDIMPTTRAALTTRLRAALPAAHAEAVIAAYPDTLLGTRALGTDLNFAVPTRHFAERHRAAGGPTWCYRFDASVPLIGAAHASELPYLWDWTGPTAAILRGRRTAARRALGRRLKDHWTAFVRDQAPGPDWPAFTLPERPTTVFSPGGDRVETGAAVRHEVWRGSDVMPRD
ncbi:carboxylesterase/lipase family protein [Microlunatus aurantiacus]|uniref:Carboxylic ester hydrolase n=1 Tax=Microlunatus aurantiacus TaxID=446786 RepID=A0ABP7EBT3_9ACTN